MGSLTVGDYDLLDFLDSPAVLATGQDLGTPEAVTLAVARLLLDGDVVSGIRYGNRAITLPLIVKGSTVGDVARVVSDLSATISQPGWEMSWQAALDEPPVIFDCFRGQLYQQWDRIARDSSGECSDVFLQVTLTFPALPFTRDQLPVVLEGTPPPDPIVVDAMNGPTITSQTTGGPAVNPYDEWTAVHSRAGILDPAKGGDTLPSDVGISTTTYVAGGASYRITAPLSRVITYSADGTRAETDYTPFTVAEVLAAPIDLSAAASIQWYARTDSPRVNAAGPLRPIYVGIPPSEADAGPAAPAIHPGSWVLRLTDGTGLTATYLVNAPTTLSWTLISLDLVGNLVVADAGFDLSTVSAYRLRLYAVGARSTLALDSPELYSTSVPSGDFVDRHNMALGPGGIPAWPKANLHVFSPGDADGAWPTNVPVTALGVYSARLVVNQAPFVDGSDYVDVQCGIDWLDGGGGVLATSYGSAVGSTFVRPVGTGWNSDDAYWLAEPIVENATAPVGTVAARVRVVAVGSAAGGDQLWVHGARIVPGAAAWRFPYNSTPGTRLWVDSLTALSPPAGIYMTTPYEQTLMPAVAGVARTPASLAIVANDPITALLVARTPKPPPGFTPFFDEPSVAPFGPTVDATCLSGDRYALADSGSSYDLQFDRSARAYNGTYAVIVRARRTALAGASITITSHLRVDTDNETFTTRAWAATGDDAVAFPEDTWKLLTVGVIDLPPREVDGANSGMTLHVHFTGTIGAGALQMDMAVLVDLAGESVVLDMPDPVERVWLDAPRQSDVTGSIVGGDDEDRSDALSLAPYQRGQAVVQLDALNDNALTVVLDPSPGGTGQITYSARWIGARPS